MKPESTRTVLRLVVEKNGFDELEAVICCSDRVSIPFDRIRHLNSE
jgi:hypothetical protein